jgi:hypothetical protein
MRVVGIGGIFFKARDPSACIVNPRAARLE